MRRRLFVIVCLVGLFALPGRAHAAVPLTHCGQTQGLECGTVEVPLDRTGATPGTVSLHVEVLPAPGRQVQGTMFLIAGGPGQGSAEAFALTDPNAADGLRQTFPGYTLVAFDNRGTGQSGVLSCPALQNTIEGTAEEFAALARDCADSIGTKREFYATRDHAEDIESVRTALGFGKIGLYGVSYGTKLALAYALAHPAAVDRLVLDSVVPTDFPDPFDANVLRQMPGTLRAFCSGGLCNAATRDYAGEVATLANQLEAHPITGTILVPGGGTKSQHMNGEDLVNLIVDSDLNPGLAVELPSAVHAALGGQTRPLLRLLDLDHRGSLLSVQDLSFGLNAATNCADGDFPWSPDAPVSSRPATIDAALAALPADAFGPFGRWAARTGTAYLCEQWPTPAGHAPLGSGPLPNVPVLIISGGYDMRTPTASAQEVANLFPQSHLLVVPGVGHSVLGADFSGCAQQALEKWLSDGSAPASCPRVPPVVKVVGALPKTHVARTRPTTLAVVGTALHEAAGSWIAALLGFSGTPLNPTGIYGGKLVVNTTSLTFRLVRYSDTPGVAVTGKITIVPSRLPLPFKGKVSVTGSSAVAGTLHVKGNTLSGMLGGRHVSAHF